MSEPIALISDASITVQEFTQFMNIVGAEVDPNNSLKPNNFLKGRFSRGDLHVWIYFGNRALEEFDENITDLIQHKLGNYIGTCIILEISRTPGSEQLAIEFVCAFAERWCCVVYNCLGTVYSIQELNQFHISGEGFRK